MIEIYPARRLDVYGYTGIKLAVEDLFAVRTDVINRAFLKPSIRPVAERHSIKPRLLAKPGRPLAAEIARCE